MEQRTEEWLEFRKSKIGSSDAPIIMGVSPWKTPLQLWEEKCHSPSNVQINAEMIRGNELEPEALAKFEELTGYLMSPKVLTHESIHWMIASLDGMDIDGKAIVEIKCPGKVDHECAMDGQIPDKYVPQLQHQMEVSGLQKIYYFSYFVTSWKIIEVYKNDDYIKNLLKKEEQFFEFITKKESPPLSEKDFKEIDCEDWNRFSERWILLDKSMEEIEKEREEIKKSLIHLASNSNAKGNGLSVTKVVRKGNVDYQSIPQLKEVDLEKHRKPSTEIWRISM